MPYYMCVVETGEIIAKQPDRPDRRTDDNIKEGYFRIRATIDLDPNVFHRFRATPEGRISSLSSKKIKSIEENQRWFELRAERNKWFILLDGAYDRASKDKNRKEQSRLLKLRKRAKDIPETHPVLEKAHEEIQRLHKEL